MSKQIEALKLALEAMEDMLSGDLTPYQASKTITSIKKALAEQQAQGCDYCNHPQYAGIKCKNCGREQPAQQQEPVAYLTEDGDRVVTAKTYNSAKKDGGAMWSTMRPFCVPSYTSPQPSKPWVGLTDEEIDRVWRENLHRDSRARAIDTKLREKNA